MRVRMKVRVCKDKNKDEVCCQTHKDEGEGEGGRWHTMMRVTVVVVLLDA